MRKSIAILCVGIGMLLAGTTANGGFRDWWRLTLPLPEIKPSTEPVRLIISNQTGAKIVKLKVTYPDDGGRVEYTRTRPLAYRESVAVDVDAGRVLFWYRYVIEAIDGYSYYKGVLATIGPDDKYVFLRPDHQITVE